MLWSELGLHGEVLVLGLKQFEVPFDGALGDGHTNLSQLDHHDSGR
jgi:hypothetical protein